MSTIMTRDYVVKDQGRFVPTKLGKAVVGLLKQHFPDIMDVGYTGEVEKYLDDISEGKRLWEPTLRELYVPFDESVERALREAERVPRELIDEESEDIAAAKTPAMSSPVTPTGSSSTIKRAKISSVLSKEAPP